MIKLLYLFVGVTLKQTIDELKALSIARVESLQKTYDAVREYRPNPAVQYGTAAAQRAIAESVHQSTVGPELVGISRQIRIMRMVPLIIYALLTAVLFLLIYWFESNSPAATN